MSEIVYGKSGISARVLTDSISPAGIRFLTFEIENPRLILAEENTHRALSKASASSRAIPFNKMKEQLTGRPVRFGQANPGMQDKGEDFNAPVECRPSVWSDETTVSPECAWQAAQEDAVFWSEAFYKAGYHKQVYNRLTEPFQMIKTVMSATEWANFFWLRDDGAADPTLHELARCMREAKDSSEPTLLKPGEWHLPYLDRWRTADGVLHYGDYDEDFGYGVYVEYSLQDAIKISTARCAAVSFRNVDYTLEKSLEVYQRLVGDERKHASAFEHQATPMAPRSWDVDSESGINISHIAYSWEKGVSHADRQGQLWSGNLRGWVQHRKLIPGENKTEY